MTLTKPTSVYRLQLCKEMDLKKAKALIPFLYDLGIEGVYTSPIFECVKSGYDIVNPNRLNPVLGTEQDFDLFCEELQKHQMALILDVVPNHMSIRSDWFFDVLKNGKDSQYASFFDIHWDEEGKIVLPLLQKYYAESLKDLKPTKDGLQYLDFHLPKEEHYRLTFWKNAGAEINYRRFFNIEDLVCLCIEKEEVFNAHSKWLLELLKTKKVQGIRLDHTDGLYDPAQYFERFIGKCDLMWIEKILNYGEELPKDWKIDGTVGYDFLNLVSSVFIQKKNENAFTKIYEEFSGLNNYDLIKYACRKRFIFLNMHNDIKHIASLLKQDLGYSFLDITRVLVEIAACYPVYRGVDHLDQAVKQAKTKAKYIEPVVFDFVQSCLIDNIQFQQLLPAIMAKGVEDAAFYIYNRLISLNEVGGDPNCFGIDQKQFHEWNQKKKRDWPNGGLATSTHDSKFSGDARARLNVLSEIPKLWHSQVNKWKKQYEKYKTEINGELIPDTNTEYYIYQMLLAVWPASFDRIWTCLNKAIREMGIYTSWLAINQEYEESVKNFLTKVLEHDHSRFYKKVAKMGMLKSLAAFTLKIGSCGIVNIYQGSEFFCFHLMDPDNRSLVNYHQNDLKFQITKKALNFRKEKKDFFLKADYIPLKTNDRVIAFIRKVGDQEIIIAVRRFFNDQGTSGVLDVKKKTWEDIFTGKKYSTVNLDKVFSKYPFTILI